MAVRTFYWDPAGDARFLRKRRTGFRFGNAGDLLNRDLISYLYDDVANNVSDAGRRLLLIGSVAHRVLEADVVAGVGTKGVPLPSHASSVRVLGVRGPITTSAFRNVGHKLEDLSFELDPGLLVPQIYEKRLSKTTVVPNRVIHVPHYRDERFMRPVPGVRIVSIDRRPADLVVEIARSEFVFTSSLHALIFAHALGRPAMLTAPLKGEPMLKYQDYFASVGLRWRKPVSLDEAIKLAKPQSPAELSYNSADFKFPSLSDLRSTSVAQ